MRLEAARAFVEETATRIDAGEGADGALNTEGAIAKYLATEAGRRRGRRRDPGARRLRLHPPVPRGEDPPRRPDHHDLRGHLGDHGDDHRPGPLAAAPQDPRRPLPRRRRAQLARTARVAPRRSAPTSPPSALECLAAVLEACRVGRLTRNQHVLLRLGELIAYAEARGRAGPPRRRGRRRTAAREGRPTVRRRRPWPRSAASSPARPRSRSPRRACAGSAGAADPGAAGRAGRRPAAGRACAPPRPGCSPTWTPSPTCSTTASPPDAHEGLCHERAPHPPDRRRRHRRDHAGRPDAAAFWQNIRDGRYSHQRRAARSAGTRSCTTTRTRPRRTRPTAASAAGCASSRGSRMPWRLPLPPKVAEQMDVGQQWAVSAARSALLDAGWPDWEVDPERVAVILGNAIGGDKHYRTTLRIQFPEFARDLRETPCLRGAAGADVRAAILEEWHEQFLAHEPEITEDTMPGELANVMAGRIANLFNFRGPELHHRRRLRLRAWRPCQRRCTGLVDGQYDAVDHRRRRPQHGRQRLREVLQDRRALGHRHPAVRRRRRRLRHGRGRRPVRAQAARRRRARRRPDLRRAARASAAPATARARASPRPTRSASGWRSSAPGRTPGSSRRPPRRSRRTAPRPASATPPSWRSLGEVFGKRRRRAGLDRARARSSPTSATSRPPPARPACSRWSCSCTRRCCRRACTSTTPTRTSTGTRTPFRVNTELREWPADPDGARRAGVSAFGFGGTNFHAVLEEYVPGRHRDESALHGRFASAEVPARQRAAPTSAEPAVRSRRRDGAAARRRWCSAAATTPTSWRSSSRSRPTRPPGSTPPGASPDPALAGAAVRVAIDYADAADLAAKAGKAVKAFRSGSPALWKMLRAQGVFVGRGPAPKVAFLYTGQGSQYVNMLKDLRAEEPVVAETFAEADRIMTPLLGRPLSSYIFIDESDPDAVARRWSSSCCRPRSPSRPCSPTDLALTRLLERLRRRARHGDGPQPRRVRRAGRRRCADLRRGARGRQRPRPRDGVALDGRQRRDGGGLRAAGRDRAGRRRRSTATSSSRTSTATARPSSAARPRRSSAPSRPSRPRASTRSGSRSATPSTPRSWRRRASR